MQSMLEVCKSVVQCVQGSLRISTSFLSHNVIITNKQLLKKKFGAPKQSQPDKISTQKNDTLMYIHEKVAYNCSSMLKYNTKAS